MKTLLLTIFLLLTGCSDVVLGDRAGEHKIAQIEVRNPGLISYDIWLVIRTEQLSLESEYQLLTGLDRREDALTFVAHVGWDSERVIVAIVPNDKLSDQDLVMTDGTRVSIVTVKN